MDTGLLRNNYTYYEGFEGEDEVVLTLDSDSDMAIHVWVGYLDDILREPVLNGSEWTGLTRDYHQAEGAFSQEGESVTVHPEEYLEDMKKYSERQFDEPETAGAFQLLVAFLEFAVQEKALVRIQVN